MLNEQGVLDERYLSKDKECAIITQYIIGPNWPVDGEIDIVEGVNNYTNNQATVHTNVGCTLASSNSNTLSISGSVVGGTDCAALTTGNQGCGIRAATSNSFGSGFNSNGGGVYASVYYTRAKKFRVHISNLHFSGVGYRRHSCLLFPGQLYPLGHHRWRSFTRYLGYSTSKVARYLLCPFPIFCQSFCNF